jgi:hypothetical protein
MQGNIKGSMGPFIAVHYNGFLKASVQGYSKVSVGPLITVHYHG